MGSGDKDVILAACQQIGNRKNDVDLHLGIVLRQGDKEGGFNILGKVRQFDGLDRLDDFGKVKRFDRFHYLIKNLGIIERFQPLQLFGKLKKFGEIYQFKLLSERSKIKFAVFIKNLGIIQRFQPLQLFGKLDGIQQTGLINPLQNVFCFNFFQRFDCFANIKHFFGQGNCRFRNIDCNGESECGARYSILNLQTQEKTACF